MYFTSRCSLRHIINAYIHIYKHAHSKHTQKSYERSFMKHILPLLYSYMILSNIFYAVPFFHSFIMLCMIPNLISPTHSLDSNELENMAPPFHTRANSQVSKTLTPANQDTRTFPEDRMKKTPPERYCFINKSVFET